MGAERQPERRNAAPAAAQVVLRTPEGVARSPLTVGAAHDPAEVEADRIADEVVRRITSGAELLSPTIADEETDQTIGRIRRATVRASPDVIGAEGGEPSRAVQSEISGAVGGGRALGGIERTQMESAFGADLGGVRVHTDARSTELNHSLGARAFTTGQDIFFAAGEYRPGTTDGQRLLAHELTHTIQQSPTVARIRRR